MENSNKSAPFDAGYTPAEQVILDGPVSQIEADEIQHCIDTHKPWKGSWVITSYKCDGVNAVVMGYWAEASGV